MDPFPGVDRFFDSLTDDYTTVIERCFPRYREMLWALLDYLPVDLKVDRILELGAGTGNLTVLLAAKYPRATIHAVDVAVDSLAVCRDRLAASHLVADHADMRQLEFDHGSFDLVTSSIAVHHLTSVEKQSLFANVWSWLRPGGCFSYADQHAGATADLNQRHIDNWHRATIEAGSTEEEWQMWMDHQSQHDHHDPTTSQIDWLCDAGFINIDCPWRFLLWTVLQATKGDARRSKG